MHFKKYKLLYKDHVYQSTFTFMTAFLSSEQSAASASLRQQNALI